MIVTYRLGYYLAVNDLHQTMVATNDLGDCVELQQHGLKILWETGQKSTC